MKKEKVDQLKKMRKASKQDSYYVTFNVPEPGYYECTWCGHPNMLNGLCWSCGKYLDNLEELYAKRKKAKDS